MAGRRIKIQRIAKAMVRRPTVSNWSHGRLKKAHNLSALCDVEAGVIVFYSKGKRFQFASPRLKRVLECLAKSSKAPADSNSSTHNVKTDRLIKFFEESKTLPRNIIADDLKHLSLRDLIHLEQQFHCYLGHIRARKEELLLDQLDEFKEKVTEAQRTRNDKLEKLVDFGFSEITGSQGDFKRHCSQCAPLTDSSPPPRADINEEVYQDLLTVECSRITHDAEN